MASMDRMPTTGPKDEPRLSLILRDLEQVTERIEEFNGQLASVADNLIGAIPQAVLQSENKLASSGRIADLKELVKRLQVAANNYGDHLSRVQTV